MSDLPYMKLYIADYLGDTQHLSTEQHGAYLLLLMAMWRTGEPLPDDRHKLCRIARIHPPRWARVSPDVLALLVLEDGFWYSRRLVKELKKARQVSAKQSANARSKSLKNNNAPSAMAEPSPSHGLAKRKPNGSLPESRVRDREEEGVSLKRETLVNARAVDHSDEQKAFDNWNTIAAELELPKAVGLTVERKRKLRPRLKEHGLLAWNQALRNLGDMPFCCGQNDRGWRVTFDWMLSPTNFIKILEKAYERTEISE